MKERPILFSSPMVRAILEGRKTQTRRVIADQENDWASVHPDGSGLGWIAWAPKPETAAFTVKAYPGEDGFKCPHGVPGDRLWVRETWLDISEHGFDAGGGEHFYNKVAYRASNDPVTNGSPWRPSIFMPRWASRITLEITGVRVQRVQEISEEDANAEGVVPAVPTVKLLGEYRVAYKHLWDSLNAKRGYGWDKNPWVWVIEFKRV